MYFAVNRTIPDLKFTKSELRCFIDEVYRRIEYSMRSMNQRKVFEEVIQFSS